MSGAAWRTTAAHRAGDGARGPIRVTVPGGGRAGVAENGFEQSLRPIRGDSVSSSIVDLITNALLNGGLKPGDRLPTETELAQRLGVGRNSVREAIKMLSSVGAVEVRRGSGTFVARSTSPAVLTPLILSLIVEQGTSLEFIQMRIVLDSAAVELILQRDSQTDLRPLEEANERLHAEAQKAEHEPHQFRDLDLAFHETLLDISGNRLLSKIGRTIYRLFFASIEKSVEADPMLAWRNHELVLDAIRRKDMNLVRQRIRESLWFWIETLEKGH
jgi:GntR family transcriptional repressor for pyruvate dehydrogenase complex